MTKQDFLAFGEQISREADVMNDFHGYFTLVAPRLWEACRLFDLFKRPLGDVLEIGAFYGYLPFQLQERSRSYTVMEGPDPALDRLMPLYQRRAIRATLLDLHDIFGPVESATHRLPLDDNSFDTLICWETMEHFNFNPVKFVRELHRVLRPGGRAYVTVPNRASFQAFAGLLFGRMEESGVNQYYQFEDYESGGKKAFYGFHWREYAMNEFALLFERVGFKVESNGTFTTFMGGGEITAGRKLLRWASAVGTKLFRRFGTNVYLQVHK